VITNSLVSHGTICVSTKDRRLLSYRLTMEGYLEGTLQRIGQRKRDIMVIGEIQMIKLGYFLLTIGPNSKFNKNTNNMP
jgi:hypothetical protein